MKGQAYSYGRRDGAAAERASIVAWIRIHPSLSAVFREHIAGQIERGEHAQPVSEKEK
jgi:hypothetical protein